MAGKDIGNREPIPADQVDYLISTAARAPSVQNTQPWQFRICQFSIELYADPGRRLRVDPLGREWLISCGAALFGLRLGIRSLGFLPWVELLPDQARPLLLASVSLGRRRPMDTSERRMLEALPHRHTHRGQFSAEPLPAGLLTTMQEDAHAEAATLTVIDRGRGYEALADIVAGSDRQDLSPDARSEMRKWTRRREAAARDGVPATAFAAGSDHRRGRLEQRDFDLGRRIGLLDSAGPVPAATAVLLTPGDQRADWLCAGQALHRILARAAVQWVFASLFTQPLEDDTTRQLVSERLALPGAPQMILQFGRARTTQATARRPPADLVHPWAWTAED
jgi:Nitroreductase family